MKKESSALETLTLIAGLTLFVGVAIMAGAIALTWDSDMTRTTVGGMLAICGGGIVAFMLTVGVFLGIAFYRRLTMKDESPPFMYPVPNRSLPYREPTPPQLPNVVEGEWRRPGGEAYDLTLWEDHAEAWVE